jgi:hypothetical protein
MKGLFIFAAGVVAGAVAGAYLVKDKIMADAKQEIEEVREYYRSKKESKKEETVEEQPVEDNEEKEEKEYKTIVENSGYVNYNKPEQLTQHSVLEDVPYAIDPEEFGDKADEGWDTMTLTYFADGVLVDDADEVVEQPDVVVGLDNLKIFEEFLDATCVYVRNETWRTDFEILRDDWKWSDLQEPQVEKKPHQL